MIAAIIQARLGSKRLPKKVFYKLGNEYLIKIMIERVKQSKQLDEIIICTSNKLKDDKIAIFCKKNKIKFYRGSENNVMLRYLKTAEKFKVDTIVRLTGDCPLIDPKTIDIMIKKFNKFNCDYLSNTTPPQLATYPDGSDIEVFKYKKLKKIYHKEKRKFYREHVTLNFWQEKSYKSIMLNKMKNYSKYRYTIDYYEDYLLLKEIYKKFKDKIVEIDTDKIVNFLKMNKKIFKINLKYNYIYKRK